MPGNPAEKSRIAHAVNKINLKYLGFEALLSKIAVQSLLERLNNGRFAVGFVSGR